MPQRNALLVGIDYYKGPKFSSLEYVTDDVVGMFDLLKNYNCRYTCDLLGAEATSKEIRQKFKKLIEQSDDDATLIFYFAGHAHVESSGVYFITKDNEDEIEDGLSFQTIAEIIKTTKRNNQSIIILLDCCHAGSLSVTPSDIISKIQNILYPVSVSIIAATEAENKAFESEIYKHGIFTHWLIMGLSGEASNENGDVTESSLAEYVAGKLNVSGKQNVVHQSISIGGSPVLSSGHHPRRKSPEPISESRIREFHHTAKRILQTLSNLKEAPADVWQNENYKVFCNKLSNLLEDRQKFSADFPQVSSDIFTQYESDFLRFRMYSADIHIGYKTEYGEIVALIGEGGFGKVYEVKSDTKTLAYKVYHPNQFHEIEKIRAFRRGYNAMKRLNHPNIVKVYDISEGPLGFTMDYIKGSNLRNLYIDKDEPIKMLDLLYQISLTISFSHTNEIKVIHRDIKPENILVVQNNDGVFIPYLTDFDLAWYSTATQYSKIADPQVVFGHYIYGAPEQINKPGSDITRQPTTDIYSFGQLAYFAVCGKDPVLSTDKTKLATEDLQARLDMWPIADAAKEFVRLYNSCVKDNPKERIQTMDEISIQIRNIKALLIDPDASRILTQETFLNQIVFSLFGLNESVNEHFMSHSKRTSIHFSHISNQKIKIKFAIESGYSSMTGKYESQRDTLTKYIDGVLSKYKGILNSNRSTEKADVFACTVTLIGNYLNYRKTNDIVSFIQDIIHQLEK